MPRAVQTRDKSTTFSSAASRENVSVHAQSAIASLGKPSSGSKTVKREVSPLPDTLPDVPVPPSEFLKHVAANPDTPVQNLMKPYLDYEKAIRAYLAQDSEHEYVADNTVGLLSVYEDGNKPGLAVRARDVEAEPKEEADRFIMPLKGKDRKKTGEMTIVEDLQIFRDNFSVFTEGSLQNLDWSNIIVAGSAVLTPLLVVPPEYRESKRTLREWYHEKLAPASDIDLFIYGIDNEEDAIKKMAQIEKTVQDNLLWETVTIRTRNTITIVSQYPNRHVQIVLRLYKSISQILTGFDVDCSCFAYDGQRILANPRAVASCITQSNIIDLSRRSPSYENRLAKYAKRGFEIYCPFLDRSRVDPTIFERSFSRTVGLAKLLVIEALPTPEQRDAYQRQRRLEMGRPPLKTGHDNRDTRNKKEMNKEEVAEWDFVDDLSSYQRFTIPYGQGLTAKGIERLFYKKDMVLNGEWNKMNHPPHRNVNLHRHPVFFGDLKDVVNDCCGYCPEPLTDEDKAVAEEEDKTFVKGKISLLTYLQDDPGRQEVGSFNPIGPEDYTEMAYVGESEALCNAIVNNDIEFVTKWCKDLPEAEAGKNAINQRDFCGRTPLHLACLSESTSPAIAQVLLDHGAKLVARVQDGRTALHFAAAKGDAELVRALLRKSAANETEKEARENGARESKRVRIVAESSQGVQPGQIVEEDEDMEDVKEDEDEEMGSNRESGEGSGDEGFESIHMSHAASTKRPRTEVTDDFVKVPAAGEEDVAMDESGEEEEDILDVNIEDWDNGMSPLHYAIISGRTEIVDVLVSEFGADIRRPIKKIDTDYNGKRFAKSAVLSLALALYLHGDEIVEMVETLIKLGASTAQATKIDRITAFHIFATHGGMDLLDKIFELDGPAATSVLNYAANANHGKGFWSQSVTPLVSALLKDSDKANYLLDKGASPKITLADTLKYLRPAERNKIDNTNSDIQLIKNVTQPLERAILGLAKPELLEKLISKGADVNHIMSYHFTHGEARYNNWNFGRGNDPEARKWPKGTYTLLDFTREQIAKINDGLGQELYNSKTPWVNRDFVCTPPEKIPEFPESVLDEFEKDTYAYFAAKNYLELKNYHFENLNKLIAEDEKDPLPEKLTRWKEALKKNLAYFTELESLLIKHDAKTFRELHPESLGGPQPKKDEEKGKKYVKGSYTYYRYYSNESEYKAAEKFEPNFHFTTPFLGEGNATLGYKKLYEAVWRGQPEDLETVKRLCFGPTKDGEEDIPALLISTTDQNKHSPLCIAALRGNYDMMDLIMEIGEKQYEKPEVKRYQNDSDNDSDDASEESSDLDMDVGGPSGRGISDEDFAVEDANAGPTEVKSNTSPFKMLMDCTTKLSYWMPEDEVEDLKPYCSGPDSPRTWNSNLITVAVMKNDLTLLKKVFELGKKYGPNDADSDSTLPAIKLARLPAEFGGNNYSGPTARFAIEAGRIEILEELMREASFGVFFEDIEEELNEEEKKARALKFYQGLTVRGKRQQEWAAAAVPSKNQLKSAKYHKPYQIALHSANKASADWITSNRPWECLMEFMRINEGSKEVRWLKKQGDKLEKWMATWLGTKTNMEAHLIIHGWNPRSEAFLRERIAARPELLTATNDQFLTPALYAVSVSGLKPARVLANLGADFGVRDRGGRNVLHMLLDSYVKLEDLNKWLKVIPPPVVLDCLTQKTKRVQRTPLTHYLLQCFVKNSTGARLAIIDRILSLSQGAELDIPNAEGNYPIHIVFQHACAGAMRMIVERRPDMLYWENANGRTPVEIARSVYLRKVMQDDSKLKIEFNLPGFYGPMDTKDMMHEDFKRKDEEEEKTEDEKKKEEEDKIEWANVDQVWTVTEELVRKARVTAGEEELPDAPAVGGTPTHAIRRKLVSLAEASLLARRLKDGEIKVEVSNRYYGQQHVAFDEGEDWSDASVLSLWGSAAYSDE